MATRSVSFLAILVSFLVAVSVKRAEADNFTVGDLTGWTVPINDDFYDNWNDNKLFRVGDLLIFNWTGDHNVVEVTDPQYEACTNVTTGVRTTSPAVFNLTRIGDHHFISTIGNNCLRGQKLEIEVIRAPPTPPGATTGAPPPPMTTATSPISAPSPGSTGTTIPPPSSSSPFFGPAVALSTAALSVGALFF